MNVEALEALLAAGTDNALLRYSLGCACLKAGRTALAVEHLAVALEHLWVVYPGDEQYALDKRITALPVRDVAAWAQRFASGA